MSEQLFTFLDRLDGRREGQGPETFLRQSQPSYPIAPRDRYRAPRHDVIYDNVEDDDLYGEDLPLDSFNERILRQSHKDHQLHVTGRQARLSFAPQSFFNHGIPSQPQILFHDHHGLDHRSQQHKLGISQERFVSDNVRPATTDKYMYDGPRFLPDSSSDPPLGASSSPAFKASQRRTGHIQASLDESSVEQSQPGNEYQPSLVRRHEERPMNSISNPAGRFSGLVTQGIQQVHVSELPDRLRTIFPYPIFNAVQSKCFDSVYRSDNNFVLASPTGSGKTVILELAICRAIAQNSTNQYKIVYQAPTKALCSERQRDWEKKFGLHGLKCLELTGDSDRVDIRNVQSANIIITTPEKWDSITRKWKDHEKLMRLINLFLIDEVHLLKEDRGAILETVVSRMKSIGTDVRFVALSATIPNFHDVAKWLSKNSAEPYMPAVNESFGEEFRPVRLQKHVYGYKCSNPNEYAFEKVLDTPLQGLIKKHSEGKPIMVFCFTRNSTVATAKLLANWWKKQHPEDRPWKAPTIQVVLENGDLRDCAASGVAFHHAGITPEDRINVEKAYLNGQINVICCTSTLAVGVNLPCHLVIIKNTVTYTQNVQKEYADLEVMQMLGRAGRPQFDDSAVAVIMTRQSKVQKYEMMVTGQQALESTLHLNLVDHLNAEIGLGTIKDIFSARQWLQGTFLYVRIKQNPSYYKLGGSCNSQSIYEQLDEICSKDINLLQEHNLITDQDTFRCTEYGHAMARYYVHFDSMRVFMGLPPKASISETLSAIAQASEFESIRFRGGEKSLYKEINKSACTRFPIPVNLDLPAHKVSLLVQSILGATDIPWGGDYGKHRVQYIAEGNVVFKHIGRLVHCIIDCQVTRGDSVSLYNALLLERSLVAKVWDDSPMQMKQISGLGINYVRKLSKAGIRSIEELECTEPHRIEMIVGRNPPFGLGILEQLKAFPKLRVSLHLEKSSVVKSSEAVKVMIKADIGFINDKPPQVFASKPIYVSVLAETSDGRKAHFARTTSRQLGKGQILNFPVLLRVPDLSINCYIMCDGIAGTMRSASVVPKISPSMFPVIRHNSTPPAEAERPASNISRRRAETHPSVRSPSSYGDEFDDGGIDDDDLVKACPDDSEFDHIDNFSNPVDALIGKSMGKSRSSNNKNGPKCVNKAPQEDEQEPRQLENGKWACNHSCKDKSACKHVCCKEGMDKPPKKAPPKRVPLTNAVTQPEPMGAFQHSKQKNTQTRLQLTAPKRKNSTAIEELDMTQHIKKSKGRGELSGLEKLHKGTHSEGVSSLSTITHQKPSFCYSTGKASDLAFLNMEPCREHISSSMSSDYGDFKMDDFQLEHEKPRYVNRKESIGDIYRYPELCQVTGSQADEQVTGDERVVRSNKSSILTDFEAPIDFTYEKETPFTSLDEAPNSEYNGNEEAKEVWTQVERSNDPLIDDALIVTPGKSKPLFVNDSSSPSLGPSNLKGSETMTGHPMFNALQDGNQKSRSDASGNIAMQKRDDVVKVGDEVHTQNASCEEEKIPDAYKDLEPWLYQEFGDIVEIVN